VFDEVAEEHDEGGAESVDGWDDAGEMGGAGGVEIVEIVEEDEAKRAGHVERLYRDQVCCGKGEAEDCYVA